MLWAHYVVQSIYKVISYLSTITYYYPYVLLYFHPHANDLIISLIMRIRLCGFEPFYDDRGDQAMFQRIIKCEYEFIEPWWDDVSLSARVRHKII